MITIESVRLRNFRAVREAFFQPLERGITGIFGSNGAGKTTILAGVLFALFGTRPPGASIGSLRRTGSGKDECSVSVLFKHMGQEVEVIRELKGSNNRVVVDIFVDGMPQTVTSVNAADTWISQRLGIDATGFLTAFVVRQKELDQLINARPAERKAIIERLAGIETINEALKKARKDEGAAKDILENLPGSQSAIEEAESQVVFLTTKVEELEEARNSAQDKLRASQSLEKKLSTEVDALRNLETDILRLTSQRESLVASNQTMESTLGRLQYLANVDDDFDIEVLRATHKTNSAAIAEKTQALNALRVQETTVENRITVLNTQIEQFQQKLNVSDVNPEDEHNLLERRAVLNERIESVSRTAATAVTRRDDLLTSVETLGHSTDCPTCHQHLAHPDKLISNLTEMADKFAEEAAHARQLKYEAEVEVEQIEASLREIHLLNENKANLQRLVDELVEVKTQAVDHNDIAEIEKQIAVLNEERERITELGVRAKTIIEDRNLQAATTATLASNTQRINDIDVQLIDKRKAFSADKLQRVQRALLKARNDSQHLTNLLNESHSEYSTYNSKLSVANNTYRVAVDQWKRKQELLKAQEQKALTTELIDKFRRESVASLTPELSENATELISDITNGAYTEIKIDDDFNFSVLNTNGDERKVGELSGGEESAVALAIRLAIGLLITGRAPELLWLDEVLTAQDADRRAAMLSTIRSLPFKQIIMINHTQDAADIVDKAITVVADLKNGSTLKTAFDPLAGLDAVPDDLD